MAFEFIKKAIGKLFGSHKEVVKAAEIEKVADVPMITDELGTTPTQRTGIGGVMFLGPKVKLPDNFEELARSGSKVPAKIETDSVSNISQPSMGFIGGDKNIFNSIVSRYGQASMVGVVGGADDMKDVVINKDIRYAPEQEDQYRAASAYSDNNPMSLVFVNQPNATQSSSYHVGSDGNAYYRAKFNTPEEGLAAGIAQVYNNTKTFDNIDSVLKRYIDPGAISTTGDPTVDYSGRLYSETGIDPNKNPQNYNERELELLVQFILKYENVLWYKEHQGDFVRSVFKETYNKLTNDGIQA